MKTLIQKDTHTHIYTHVYTYIYTMKYYSYKKNKKFVIYNNMGGSGGYYV